jgi:parallel beta-helix repeat protein
MINRSIELYGDDQTMLTIHDARVNPVFIVNADMVNITGLSIENNITDTMEETMFLTALELWSSSSTLDSVFINDFDMGIKVQSQTSNIIRNTTITNASTGIEIWDSEKITVTACKISHCDQSGVYIGFDATLNMVSHSSFQDCEYGVRIKAAEENTVYRNSFISCRKPFYECCGAANNEYVFNTEE